MAMRQSHRAREQWKPTAVRLDAGPVGRPNVRYHAHVPFVAGAVQARVHGSLSHDEVVVTVLLGQVQHLEAVVER